MAIRMLRPSSGSAFRELGFSFAESENLRIRSELMAKLASIIERRELTQTQAARSTWTSVNHQPDRSLHDAWRKR